MHLSALIADKEKCVSGAFLPQFLGNFLFNWDLDIGPDIPPIVVENRMSLTNTPLIWFPGQHDLNINVFRVFLVKMPPHNSVLQIFSFGEWFTECQ